MADEKDNAMNNDATENDTHDAPLREELTLAERFIEGVITEDESARLEQIVCSDAAARRRYVTYMSQHAALRWHRGQPADASDESMLMRLATDEGTDGPRAHTARASMRRAGWRRVAMFAMAAAALLVVGAWAGFGMMAALTAERTPEAIATLTDTKRCRWDSGTLPTESGAELNAGRLRLTEGLATIRFRSGAKVVLEGPADLELVDPMRCVLHAGVLVADVPEPAHGFVVDTPHGKLIDHGTEFGVTVDSTGDSVLQVFKGDVEVQHAKTGESRHAETGVNLRVRKDDMIDDDLITEAARVVSGVRPVAPGAWVSLTTATDRGRDTFVQDYKKPEDYHTAPGVLMCKSSTNTGYNRKVYLAFDLAALRGRPITDAEFIINVTPSGRGFGANLPDCTFTVYGVTDESQDVWTPESVLWDTAPAYAPGPSEVDMDKAVPLGTFTVEQGIQSGARRVRGQALVDFLSHDTNGIVTLVICRDTRETRGGNLVHGFASSTHPTVAPPTLRVITE